MTLDDYYRLIIEPKAAAGDPAAICALRVREEAKAGTLTPERCSEMAHHLALELMP